MLLLVNKTMNHQEQLSLTGMSYDMWWPRIGYTWTYHYKPGVPQPNIWIWWRKREGESTWPKMMHTILTRQSLVQQNWGWHQAHPEKDQQIQHISRLKRRWIASMILFSVFGLPKGALVRLLLPTSSPIQEVILVDHRQFFSWTQIKEWKESSDSDRIVSINRHNPSSTME